MRGRNSLLIIAFTTLLIGGSIAAQDLSPQQEKDALLVFSSVMSPFCPGRLLADCPTERASELKKEIRAELASGKSSQVLIPELIARFGEDVRAIPKPTGFGVTSWFAPYFFLGFGVILGALWLRSNKFVTPNLVKQPDSIDPILEERIQRDLERLE